MKATAPSGDVYKINRRWWPWHWKRRTSAQPWDLDFIGGAANGADDPLSFVVLLVCGLAACFVLPIVFLLLITGVEFLALLVVLPLALVMRLIFGKHWVLQIRHAGDLQEIDGGTWRESETLIHSLAAQVTAGEVHLPSTGTTPVS